MEKHRSIFLLRYRLAFLGMLCLMLCANGLSAQNTAAIPLDTVSTQKEISFSSNKALLFSAIVPGGGQFYNRKYWKVPIVYGGFVALGLAIDFNGRFYNEFVRELNYRGDGDPLTVPKYDEERIPDERIVDARNYYRRYRDLSIIGVAALYGLSIVDAYIDAELSNFDISEDLGLRVQPTLFPAPVGGFPATGGISLTLRVK